MLRERQWAGQYGLCCVYPGVSLCLWSASGQCGQLHDVSCPRWKVTNGTKFGRLATNDSHFSKFQNTSGLSQFLQRSFPVLTLVRTWIKSGPDCYQGIPSDNCLRLLGNILTEEKPSNTGRSGELRFYFYTSGLRGVPVSEHWTKNSQDI
jgi:hypothetical protein